MATFTLATQNSADDCAVYGTTQGRTNATTWFNTGIKSTFGFVSPNYICPILRWDNVTIPQGATINSAVINFVADGSNSTPTIRIQAEDVDDADTIDNATEGKNAIATTAYVDWSPASWSAGSIYSTDDFASVIQEIVNRASWVSGNAINIFLDPQDTSGYRQAATYDHTSYDPAEIEIGYTAAASGGWGNRIIGNGIV